MVDDNLKELILFNLTREDALNNNRITWLLAFQGFVFAAYAFCVKETEKESVQDLAYIIPCLGLVSSVVALVVITMGACAIRRLNDLWFANTKERRISPFGLLQGKPYHFYLHLGLSNMLPSACFIAWLAIIILSYFTGVFG